LKGNREGWLSGSIIERKATTMATMKTKKVLPVRQPLKREPTHPGEILREDVLPALRSRPSSNAFRDTPRSARLPNEGPSLGLVEVKGHRKRARTTWRSVMASVFVALSCVRCGGTPTAPASTAAITSVRYEHVSDVAIESDTRVELEFVDCRKNGLLPALAGPDICLLARDTGNVYRCPASDFMKDASTTCDNTISVRLRTASGNPFFATAHDIYINGTKVSRLSPNTALSYPQEYGSFAINAAGKIH
jgi:hypothetical protein